VGAEVADIVVVQDGEVTVVIDKMYVTYYIDTISNTLGGTSMVKTISTAEARATLGDVLNGVYYTHNPVMVQKKGKTVAVIISPDEFARLQAADARDWASIERIGERNAGQDPDAILAEVTAVVEEVRQEHHAG
jgi:prevent-host-death family protein